MAISLPTAINGVSGNFWRTKGIYISPDYSMSRVFMALYTSQAAYTSGAAPLYQTDYILQGAANTLIPRDLISLSEPAMIANVSQFSGGTFVSGV